MFQISFLLMVGSSSTRKKKKQTNQKLPNICANYYVKSPERNARRQLKLIVKI